MFGGGGGRGGGHVDALLFLLLIILARSGCARGLRCDRTPEGTQATKSMADDRFVIEVSGNPATYVPGEQYTLFLRSNTDYQMQHKFKDFTLVVEHENSERILGDSQNPQVGSLQLYGDMLTKFSEKCRNSVMQTNSLPKSEVQVLWLAPASGSGCVAIRATVVESKDVWFSDDGKLSKVLCEEMQESEDAQPNVLRHCCACDEAKYEVTFEGLWSRNTHPKDFPSNGWLTRFSDIIGASHTVDYTFWSYGDVASEGLRQLAENGNTRMLESELKAKSEHIRTIIKARGISYPNITGKTFAVFRVDSRHHLMSLVSMIDPSPDWIVGVSGLELCLRNCSWIENKVLNLYPWDAGTDDGPTYISPNQPSNPRDPIRRIKSNSPNDPRSPFYDPSGAEMKPLGRLYLSRQRLYEKQGCDSMPMDNDDDYGENGGDNCEVTEWSDWSPCSANCGKGIKYKQRGYKNKDRKNHCTKQLTQRAPCYGIQRHCRNPPHTNEHDPHCVLTDWGEWSSCSVSCGRGWKTRSRRYRNRNAAKRCAARNENPPLLEQNLPCFESECPPGEELPGECEDKEWSAWSPCSASCGKGIKVRRRIDAPKYSYYNNRYRRGFFDNEDADDEDGDDDGDSDDSCPLEEKVECINDENPVCEDDGNLDPDQTVGGIEFESHTLHRNKMGMDGDVVGQGAFGQVIDCKVSAWSRWSPCNATCGHGFKTKYRTIKVHPQNGGKRCPEKLIKKHRCEVRCGEENNQPDIDDLMPTWGPAGPLNNVKVDCVMSKWSAWSPCSRTCGPNAVQQRTRSILIQASGKGQPCLHRTEERACSLLACPE